MSLKRLVATEDIGTEALLIHERIFSFQSLTPETTDLYEPQRNRGNTVVHRYYAYSTKTSDKNCRDPEFLEQFLLMSFFRM